MKITYKFANGETSIIEVTEEWAEVTLDHDRTEYNINHKETRRHTAFDSYVYLDDQASTNPRLSRDAFESRNDICSDSAEIAADLESKYTRQRISEAALSEWTIVPIAGWAAFGGQIIKNTISYKKYASILELGIHFGKGDGIMLGKYDSGGTTSYIKKAGEDYTYFDLGDKWNIIKEQYRFTDEDMFYFFNVPFLDYGINERKTFNFSHDPTKDKGFLGLEYSHLEKSSYMYDPITMIMTPID